MTQPVEHPAFRGFRHAGTSQAERLLPALLPTQPLDGRGLPELLAYVAQLSEKINFYQHPDETTPGAWELARHRSLLLLALVAAQPNDRLADEFANRLLPLTDPAASLAQQQAARQVLMHLLHQEVGKLNGWYIDHQLSNRQGDFASALQQVFSTLLPGLRQAAHYEALLLDQGLLTGAPQLPLSFVATLSNAATPLADAATLATEAQGYADRFQEGRLSVAQVTATLTKLFWQVHKAHTILQGVARQELLRDLQQHDHHPEVGLLVAFLQLYAHTQQVLNDIPQRHLDYYYEEVLRAAYRPSQPDHAYLSFGLAQGYARLLLPAGTLVEGGKDAEGRRVQFATVQPAELSTWHVTALATLFVARYPPPQAGPTADPPGRVTGVYATTPLPASATPPTAAAAEWPLLGEDPTQTGRLSPFTAMAPVGFAVSAPVLALREGLRTITLRLHATPQSLAGLQTLAADPASGSLQRVLFEAFEAQVTGPAGWLPVALQGVELNQAASTITWTLLLDRTQPAVGSYDATHHGGRYSTGQPVLRLVLNTQATTYGYSYFADLEPLRLDLHVRVQHLHHLALSNQLGSLDGSAPFYPFGAQGLPGAYLTMQVPELMGKDLTHVTLALTWQNLPLTGLADYYAGYGYDPAFTDADFVVTPAYLAAYQWQPGLPQRLFQAGLAGSSPQPLTLLHLSQPGYLTPAADGSGGLLRVLLTAPVQGFGAATYPAALASTVRYNAHHAAHPQPLPQPPFVPQLSRLTVSYEAQEKLYPGQGPQLEESTSFYHLHPFGEYEPANAGPLRLLTTLPDEGTLLVGLSPEATGQFVSLIFELTIPSEADLVTPLLAWAYLHADEWHPLTPGGALWAAQPGFANSCQVQVRLPATLSTTHRLLPSGHIWLRASVAAGAATFGQVTAIYPQLVQAVRLTTGSPLPAPYQQTLPAGQLVKLPRAVPGIASVTQPRPSFGGRVAENRLGYYTRVSEQLRHRHRALTPWDYEHLVLEQFPTVYSAKCLTADQLPPPRQPGQVLLLVLPQPDLVPGSPRPLFGASQLREMQQYLQPLTSPAVQLTVHNPSYELVQVRGQVAFRVPATGPPLSYEQQLQHDIAEFLSPWHHTNPRSGGFHRHLTLTAIEAFINQLPYVAGSTGLSVVKTGLLDGRHRFYDSAAGPQPPPAELGALAPWAVLVPADQQVFTVGSAPLTPTAPVPTGVGQLRIEQDFVVACDF